MQSPYFRESTSIVSQERRPLCHTRKFLLGLFTQMGSGRSPPQNSTHQRNITPDASSDSKSIAAWVMEMSFQRAHQSFKKLVRAFLHSLEGRSPTVRSLR